MRFACVCQDIYVSVLAYSFRFLSLDKSFFFYDSLRKMKIYLAWEDEKNNLANLGNFTKLSDKIN